MRSLLVLLTVLAVGGTAGAQPANDACGAATSIRSLPFTATIDTTAATVDLGDPHLSCSGAEDASVWFSYTASHDVTLLIDTIGSDYGTAIAVYTGGCATPTELACGADQNFDGQTALAVPIPAGTTVLLLVTAEIAGGNLVLHVKKAPYDASPPRSLDAIVRSGDPSPTGGGFSRIVRPVTLSKTDVAFTATTTGVFVHDGSGTTTIAISGDASPLGGTWSSFGQPVGATGGTVAFAADLNGAGTDSGLFVYSGGTTSPLVVRGDPAPGGGTFVNFVRGIAISPNGTLVAFIADTTLSPSESLWVATVGGGVAGPLLTELVDPSPCGGTVRAIGNSTPVMSINDAGEIALFARSGAPTIDEVLRYSGGWSAVACEGTPTPLGGTYRAIARSVRIANAPGGLVTFVSTVTLPGPDSEAVFARSAGGVFVVAADGDVTTGGATISGFASTAFGAVTPAGDVFFHATTSAGNQILTRAAGAPAATAVVSTFDPCPAGGVFNNVDTWVDTDASGAVVFRAGCTGSFGVFRIPSGGSPAVVALQSEVTPAGAGFSFDNPTVEGASTAFPGSRVAVYRVHCDADGCDPVTVLAQPLAALPGLPGEAIATIDPDFLAGQGGLVTFVASTFGPIRRTALLASRSGTLELVAATGLTLPGTAVEIDDIFANLQSAISAPAGADKRSIAFAASITDQNDLSATRAVYLARNGTISEIARDGELAPSGDPSSTFGALLVKGSRVFFGTDAGSRTCFVAASGSTRRNLGCTGDPIDTPVGTTLSTVEPDLPALASRGPVFRAQVTGVGSNECLFTAVPDGPTPVVCTNDLLPYGGEIGDFSTIVLGAARRRVVSFANDQNFIASGLYEFSDRARARIAGNGLPTPLGGLYSMTDTRPSIYAKAVAFVSDVDAGPTQQALFFATLRH